MFNYTLVNCDTDSLMVTKPNGAPWSKEEQEAFLENLNKQFPEKIRFEHDGIFTKVAVFGSKNYALLPEGKKEIKTKGSSIRDQKKEPALREMMDKMIAAMMMDEEHLLVDIYLKYVKEARDTTDIRRWCQKKSVTEAILDCKGYTEADIVNKKVRRNETNVWDAIAHKEGIQLGDKIYVYPAILERQVERTVTKKGIVKEKEIFTTGLRLIEDWDSDHDSDKLVERVYDTVCIFEKVLDMNLFINYSLKRNQKALQELK